MAGGGASGQVKGRLTNYVRARERLASVKMMSDPRHIGNKAYTRAKNAVASASRSLRAYGIKPASGSTFSKSSNKGVYKFEHQGRIYSASGKRWAKKKRRKRK